MTATAAKWKTKSRFDWKRSAALGIALIITLGVLADTQATPRAAATSQTAAPNLGAAIAFGVLAGSAVTNTGASVVDGNLGISPGTAVTGFPPGTVTGTIHKDDGAAMQAKSALAGAYIAVAGDSCGSNLSGQNLGGRTLTPGVYCFSSAASLTGTLTLNAEGDNNAAFIFQIGSALTTASGSSMVMTNGASGCDVFWQVGSSATLNGPTFAGNVMALASITVSTSATVAGSLLARNGAVTLAGADTIGAFGSTSTCSSAVINALVVDATVPVKVQAARNFTESSAEYRTAVDGYTSTFTIAGNVLSVNFTNFNVAWTGFAMNYILTAANGSEYTLTIGANPVTKTLSPAIIQPISEDAIASYYSTTYSGYAVATSSSPIVGNDTVPYASTDYYLPTVSGTSTLCGSTVTSSPHVCRLAVWTGLQNSTYLGENNVPSGSGEVIQTGTFETISCSPTCSTTYGAWGGFLFGNSGGVQRSIVYGCSSLYTPSPGDQMIGVVGRGDLVNGSSSSEYFTVITDHNVSTNNSCYYPFTSSTTCSPAGGGSMVPCQISFKEYFADYFVETPQCGSSCSYTLPKFSLPHGDNLFNYAGMMSDSQGTYPYYNDGYYMYTWMENGGTNDTSVTAMSEYCCGSTYASFNETYLSSAGTGF